MFRMCPERMVKCIFLLGLPAPCPELFRSLLTNVASRSMIQSLSDLAVTDHISILISILCQKTWLRFVSARKCKSFQGLAFKALVLVGGFTMLPEMSLPMLAYMIDLPSQSFQLIILFKISLYIRHH